MNDEENNMYNQQRLQGKDQIEEYFHELAEERGITLDTCEWDQGREIGNRENHILEITSNGRRIRREFSDERLADYPGRVGNERTNAILNEMILELSEPDENQSSGD